MGSLIGLAGRARSGKTTVADYLTEHHFFIEYAFAGPLKRACAEMLGIGLEYFHEDDLKEQPHPFWGFSPRKVAQIVGTDCGRNMLRKDIWLKRAEIFIESLPFYENVVVTDIRFENETDFIRNKGGTVVHIQRDNIDGLVRPHESENGVEIQPSDIVIANNGSIKDLYQELEKKVVYSV